MTNNLLDNVRHMLNCGISLPPHAHVLIALSGGADSVALLHALRLLREEYAIDRLAAVHIHHGLRGSEADRDAKMAAEHCERCCIPLFTQHIDVAALAAEQHVGLEEAGRMARYQVFDTLMESQGFTHVATAHTKNDNTETVLLHLVRGTSPGGLRGIPATRDRYIRPLLSSTREEVEAFCNAHTLRYAVDSTNEDIAFSRNRIRNCVVPHLYALNSRVHEAVYRLSRMADEDETYWQSVTDQALRDATVASGVYSASVLLGLPLALQRRVIHRILARCGGVYEDHLVRKVMAALTNGGSVTVGEGLTLSVKQNYLTVNSAVVSATEARPLIPDSLYSFGDTVYRAEVWDRKKFENQQKIHKILLQYTCDYDKIKGAVCVRSRREGDECDPYRRGGRRTLKKWMNTEKVPATRRDLIPVVADEDGVVLVVGLGCDTRVAIDSTTQQILLFLKLNEEDTMYA